MITSPNVFAFVALLAVSSPAPRTPCSEWEFFDPNNHRCIPCALCNSGESDVHHAACRQNIARCINTSAPYGCHPHFLNYECSNLPYKNTYAIGTSCNVSCNGRDFEITECTYRKLGEPEWDYSNESHCAGHVSLQTDVSDEKNIPVAKQTGSPSLVMLVTITVTGITLVTVTSILLCLCCRKAPRHSCLEWLKTKLRPGRRGTAFREPETVLEEIIPSDQRPPDTEQFRPNSEPSLYPPSSTTPSSTSFTDMFEHDEIHGRPSVDYALSSAEGSGYQEPLEPQPIMDVTSAQIHTKADAVEHGDGSDDTGIGYDLQDTRLKVTHSHVLHRDPREAVENVEEPSLAESDTSGIATGVSVCSDQEQLLSYNIPGSQFFRPQFNVTSRPQNSTCNYTPRTNPRQAAFCLRSDIEDQFNAGQTDFTTPLMERERRVTVAPVVTRSEPDENTLDSSVVYLSDLHAMTPEESDQESDQTYLKHASCRRNSSDEPTEHEQPSTSLTTSSVHLGSQCSLPDSAQPAEDS